MKSWLTITILVLAVGGCTPSNQYVSPYERVEQQCSQAGFKDEKFNDCVVNAWEAHNQVLVEQQKTQEEAKKQVAKAQLKADNDNCVSYGFKKGTDKFASCMMQLELSRKQEEQNKEAIVNQQLQTQKAVDAQDMAAKAQMLQAITNMNQQQYHPPQFQPIGSNTVHTNCIQNGNSISCNTQ